jgi:hypothetical protein
MNHFTDFLTIANPLKCILVMNHFTDLPIPAPCQVASFAVL